MCPMQIEKYPLDWKAISLRVRAEAGNKCEWCSAPNRIKIIRVTGGYWRLPEEQEYRDRHGKYIGEYESYLLEDPDADTNPFGKVKIWQVEVVLTVAHIGPNKHDKQDCSSLAALCQMCHLHEDKAEHAANRRKTLAAKRARTQPALALF